MNHTDPTVLRDRVAEALADIDGWQWAPGYNRALSPAYQRYLARADKVLAVLPEPNGLAADEDACLAHIMGACDGTTRDCAFVTDTGRANVLLVLVDRAARGVLNDHEATALRARAQQVINGRETWKAKAEEIERIRDSLADELKREQAASAGLAGKIREQREALDHLRGELEADRAETARWLAFIERGMDTHMQFSVLKPDGTTEQLPCADWCYACRLERAQAERDGAYRERAHLVALLAAMADNAVIAPALDLDEPGWWIVYLTIGGRQASWHISPRDAGLFAHVERVDPDDPRAQWDGHTTEEKYAGIAAWTVELAQQDGSTS